MKIPSVHAAHGIHLGGLSPSRRLRSGTRLGSATKEKRAFPVRVPFLVFSRACAPDRRDRGCCECGGIAETTLKHGLLVFDGGH